MVEKFKTYLKKYFPNGLRVEIIAVVILSVLIGLVFSTRKTIVVSVDGSSKKITTFCSTYRKVLDNNGISIGPKDKVKPSLDNRVENNTTLKIKRVAKVRVEVDNKKLNLESAEDNVEDMLKAEKIGISKLDIVYPSRKHELKKGMNVVVTRVKTKDIKENTPINYDTILKSDEQVENGTKKVVQEGQNGEKETVTRVVYQNGKEVSKKVISEIIKKQPIQKVIAIGTLTDYTPSRGSNLNYVESLQMRATAYTADYASTGKSPGDPAFGITASGTVARRNNGDYSSVAVDPRVIPLGTKLYIEGYGYAIAEDTGGAIKGNRLDLFFNSNSEVDNWGVRWVNVYVIK